jgi:uncharacterized protein (TIGR03435 family)
MARMKLAFQALALALSVCSPGICQTPASPKLEFDVVAINASAPQSGHFHSPASSKGGPGTADPTFFRCINCDLSFLITKAFQLQRYQFPGQASLPDTAFDVSARVPEGTTAEQFGEMLRNLLKDRFGLAYRYDKKQMQGYDLVVAKNGPKLTESSDAPKQARAEASWHGSGNDGGHEHSGLMVFGGRGRYNADHQTTGDLAQVISSQLAKPVDNQTGLSGKYDIILSWSDDGSHSAGDHASHGGEIHESAGAAPDGTSGPTLAVALQSQLGLKLEPKKVTASVFIVDHIDKVPAPK